MDDRRVALLVGGVGLIVVGVVTTTFPRGIVLGLVSITVGVLLAVPAAIRLVAAVRERPVRNTVSSEDVRAVRSAG